jgi:hypothetical protein
MFVMHEPMKTSSIFVPCTSLSVFASSGSFGQHKIGSLMSSMQISMTVWYSAPGSAFKSSGFESHASIPAMRRSIVRRSP